MTNACTAYAGLVSDLREGFRVYSALHFHAAYAGIDCLGQLCEAAAMAIAAGAEEQQQEPRLPTPAPEPAEPAGAVGHTAQRML